MADGVAERAEQDGAATPGSASARLGEVLDRLPSTRGRSRQVTEVEGGLTNRIVRVRTDEQDVVVRLSDDDSTLLAIDRDAEHVNSRRAADAGAAPAIVDFLPGEGVLVVEWVEGRTYGPEDLRDETNLLRVADACRLLHAGERFDGDFDMRVIHRRYLDIVTSRGFRLPDGYLDLQPAAERVAAALDVGRQPTVPCHNDLLAANFLDDGERVWIIDYEYAGNNDPDFELGNIWAESALDDEHLAALAGAYLGRHDDVRIARARLWGQLSQYGWTLWASIQDATSDIDFDFWGWGMEKYERAVGWFHDPGFEALLDRAAGRRSG